VAKSDECSMNQAQPVRRVAVLDFWAWLTAAVAALQSGNICEWCDRRFKLSMGF
jgi:hypothetical protein